MSKTLVAYFSASGVTALSAKEIANALGADLYEIEPEVRYTNADLNWMDKKSRSTLEMQDPASRPPLAHAVPDTSGYDRILVGFPIWWGVEPRCVDTFLDGANIAGKTLIPFATSGGTGIGSAEANLKKLYPAASWKSGRLVNSRNAASWAKGL